MQNVECRMRNEQLMLNILIIGSGGREHALAWKISQSPNCGKLYAMPGNPGIEEIAECVKNISIDDNKAIIDFAKNQQIDLVVIGPEAPLVNGLVDDLTAANIKTFGPTKSAAQIEGSKILDEFMAKIPMFVQNPALRQLPLDYLIQRHLSWTQRFYEQCKPAELDALSRKEMTKYCGENMPFFAYLYNAVHFSRHKLLEYEKTIKELKDSQTKSK